MDRKDEEHKKLVSAEWSSKFYNETAELLFYLNYLLRITRLN